MKIGMELVSFFRRIQKQNKQKIIQRDENGRVKTQPRNITSNLMSKIERQYMKNPEYVADPVERKK